MTPEGLDLARRACKYVEAMVPRADINHQYGPLWHGWALREAWLAGHAEGKRDAQEDQP